MCVCLVSVCVQCIVDARFSETVCVCVREVSVCVQCIVDARFSEMVCVCVRECAIVHAYQTVKDVFSL